MKRLLFVGIVCMMLSVCCALGQAKVYAQGNAESDKRLITVSGEAQVNVTPDEVIVSIGVQACGDTASEARDNEAKLAQAIMAVAKELKIDPKFIQTDAIEVDLVKPYNYDWRISCDSTEPKKYGARQMFVFTIKDVSNLTPLITKAFEAGATRVLGVEYRTSKLRSYRDQARSLAIRAAKEKATAMAGDLDQKIGKPHKITESPYYGRDWHYYGSWWSYRTSSSSSNWVQNVAPEPGSGGGSEDVALGQISVTAKVSVSFELR